MAGSVMSTSMFNDSTLTITKNLKILTAAAFKTHPDEYKMITQMESTDLKNNQRIRYEGGGAAGEKAEGDAASQKRIYEGNKESTTQTTYAVEIPVTWEQRKYVAKNAQFMNQIAQYNARSMKLIKEYDCANILNNGFSSSVTGYDGKAYFASDHTWRSDSSTYDNLLNPVDLSRDAIEDAFVEMANVKIEAGIPANVVPRKIIIGYENIFTLPELLKTVNDPESANNTYNVIRDFNIKPVLNHYLTSGDDYFIDSDMMTRTCLVSQKTTFDSYMQNETLNLVERGMAAHGTMFHDQLGSFGSQGA